MVEKQITVYDALIEISRLNDKIKKFNSSNTMPIMIGCSTENAKKVKGYDKDEYTNLLKSNYDSIRHLISNLGMYKAKVAQSNAITTITVSGKEYTIAEAIQRKQNINTEIRFLNMIRQQINSVNHEISSKDHEVENGLSDYLSKIKNEDSTSDDIDKFTESYYKNNKYTIIDPNDLVGKIDELESNIEDFLNEIDSKITASNCKTLINVELED